MLEINCPNFMVHEVNPYDLEKLIADNLNAGRVPMTVYRQVVVMRGLEKAPADLMFSISFDDRLKSQWDYARPLLEKYKIPATFYAMSPGWHGDGGYHNYMTDDQLTQIPRYHEIGDHTINHPTNPNLPQLRKINWGEYAAEISESKDRLETLTGRKMMTFASPQSFYDDQLIKDIISLGYIGAVATFDGDPANYSPIQRDPMQIMRLRIS